jgi:hypothetical protein
MCCRVHVSATSWSLVQRSPTDCGASLCVIKKPQKWGGHVPRGATAPRKTKTMCCRVDVSATSWSLVQRSPTDCGASLCVIKKPQKWGGHSPRWAAAPQKTNKILVNEQAASYWTIQPVTKTIPCLVEYILLDLMNLNILGKEQKNTQCHIVIRNLFSSLLVIQFS